MRSSPASSAPHDTIGAATLQELAKTPAFNRWMFDRLSRWIGPQVLEVGSGIGNMSQWFIDRDRVVLTDPDPVYREELRRRFGHRRSVSVTELSLPTVPPDLERERFDSIVCLNVLEHVEDDAASLSAMRTLLKPGGHLVLLVPALRVLYGSLDRALGHVRRYTAELLRSRYREAGLRMARLEYFNLAGIPGWWFTGRVLKRNVIPSGPLALYDRLVPVFRWERFLPFRIGQSLIAIGVRPE